jgi:L-ascorbate metabolism protein UlaG (beta-lactamase superfamily)
MRISGWKKKQRIYSRRAGGQTKAALLLWTLAMLLIMGCAATQTQNTNTGAAQGQQDKAQTGATPAPASSQEGDITITPIVHASFQIEYGGKVIHVDPTSPGDYSHARQADLILITDIHGDHLDPAAIARIRKQGAPVVAPKAAAEKIENPTVMANGETKTIAGISIEAVPMYNLKRGPSQGQFFHTKGRGNGYVLTLGSRRLYIAGDTECTPEMRSLKNIDIAFIPMNLPYTMPPSEATECVKAFKPKVVYPYHYRGQNVEEFKAALKDEPIDVRLFNWYPQTGGVRQ